MRPTGSAIAACVRRIVTRVGAIEPGAVGLDDELSRSGIDSLLVLRIVAEVETEYGIRLSDEEFSSIRTLRALVAAVETRLRTAA